MTTGKINEPVTLTSQQAGDWTQTQGPSVNMKVELDGSQMSFTPSENGTYEFQRGGEKFTVQVGDTTTTNPPPDPGTGGEQPPQPQAGQIYNCITTGRWNENRTITDFDPLFPKPFQGKMGIILAASGANKQLAIENGVAKFSAGGGHPRYYVDCPNYNTYTTYDIMFLDELVRNHTHQRQSRHNLGGDEVNRFGGFNHLIDLEGQKVGLKMELWHTPDGGEHLAGDDKALPKKLDVNQWLGVKNTDKIVGRKVTSSTELDYHDGNGWVDGVSFTYDLSQSVYDFIFQPELYRSVSSEWFRMNPNQTTKGFAVKDYSIFQL